MKRIAEQIKDLALSEGFAAVGITTAEPLSWLEPIVEARVRAGYLAGMPWFDLVRARNVCRPKEASPGTRAVIALAFAYGNPGNPPDLKPIGLLGHISRYAGADDYHHVVTARAKRVLQLVSDREPAPCARLFCDSGRLLDRGVAQRAGVGWYGKNCSIIVPGWGSWVFLAEIVTSLALDPDAPADGKCGGCDVCLRSCPTGALVQPYVVDSRRCVAFLTIELKGYIPRELRPLIGTRVFGCDACQTCCPHNQGSRETPWPELRPTDPSALLLELPPLLQLSDHEFKARFRGSPLFRAGRGGLLRSAAVVLGNGRDRAAVPALCGGLADPDPVVRAHVAWALGRLGGPAARHALDAARHSEAHPEVAMEITNALAR